MTKRRKPYSPVSAVDRRAASNIIPFRPRTADRIVDDPYSDTGGKSLVTASLRDDPLGRMHARRQIDDCQYAVGRQFQAWLELVAPAGPRAADTTKEPVDGRGATVEPFTESQRRAGKNLYRARQTLGERSYVLVCAVLGERQFIEQIAESVGLTGNWEIRKLQGRFRECLDELAVLFGFADTAPAKRRVHDQYSAMARGLKVAA